jgi:alkylated DNA repair dioxygenase AlkB
MVTPPSQLSLFQPDLPEGLSLLENYVSGEEVDQLIAHLDTAPWRTDLKRRVQHYGYRYDYKARQARREDYLGPLPAPLEQMAKRLTTDGHFKTVPDQVIINEYMPGQGISAHIDCQPCFGDTVASLSLLSACVMRFAHPASSKQIDLQLQPSSLLVMGGPSRHAWTHAIPSRKTDTIVGQKHHRSRRISLTFRTMLLDG